LRFRRGLRDKFRMKSGRKGPQVVEKKWIDWNEGGRHGLIKYKDTKAKCRNL
jgi:hypothetical protein